jgi:hypothetical protein
VFADLAAPVVELAVAIGGAESLVLVVGRDWKLGAAPLISATNAQTWHRRHQLDGHRSLSIKAKGPTGGPVFVLGEVAYPSPVIFERTTLSALM